MTKLIRNLNIDYSDISAIGDSRSFVIEGDSNAIFSMEVKNEDGYYYNFDTQTFAAAKKRLKQKSLGANGRYSDIIVFPTVTDNDQYDIYLYAESHYDTKHSPVTEVRFGDGSLDLNSTVGSNSALLQKVIYQYLDTALTIKAGYQQGADDVSWVSSLGTSDAITIPAGKGTSTIPFTVSATTATTTTAVRILRQPTPNDFYIRKRFKIDTAVPIAGENVWAEPAGRSSGATDGQTRGSNTINGAVEGAAKIIVDTLPGGTQVGDRLTGSVNPDDGGLSLNGAGSTSNTPIVTVTVLNPDGDNANEFTVSENITVADGATVYFNAPYYYRWSSDESNPLGDVRGLTSGLKESKYAAEENPDTTPAQGGNSPGTLGPYLESTSYTVENLTEDGSIVEQSLTTTSVSYPAVDTTGYDPVITNGKVSRQGGVITFTQPQKHDKIGTTLDFYPRGVNAIKDIYDIDLEIRNLNIELTDSTGVTGTVPTTTTTSAVSASATIPVADREGTIQNVSTIGGIGINSAVANPTITSSTADGAGSWTASAAQTLESGATLTINNTSRYFIITGDIVVTNNNSRETAIDFTIDIAGLVSSS